MPPASHKDLTEKMKERKNENNKNGGWRKKEKKEWTINEINQKQGMKKRKEKKKDKY